MTIWCVNLKKTGVLHGIFVDKQDAITWAIENNFHQDDIEEKFLTTDQFKALKDLLNKHNN